MRLSAEQLQLGHPHRRTEALENASQKRLRAGPYEHHKSNTEWGYGLRHPGRPAAALSVRHTSSEGISPLPDTQGAYVTTVGQRVPTQRLDPYANPRAFYTRELRRLRRRPASDGRSWRTRFSVRASTYGQFEQVVRAPQVELSEPMDGVLGSNGLLRRLAKLARKSQDADYFADAAAPDPTAKSISEYSAMVVPGLLQRNPWLRQPSASPTGPRGHEVSRECAETRQPLWRS